MSTPGPDDSLPQSSDELGGLDPKDLFNAALETAPSITLSPQPADPDATEFVTPSSTGIKLDARQELPLPEELTQLLPAGAYKVESFLGQGGMGAVYKGTQVRLKRPVAIKIMRRDFGKDHGFEARFEREAQAMAKLNHPNIVSVIDFGEAGPDYLYIVMELIDGADMMDVIRTGRMTQEMALTLLPQICDALQFAHDHGIVHRDIKPSNIMLTRDGRIKMADFGLAKRYDAESSFRTQTGTGMGTPDYAAPEQFDAAAQIDHRADIYALGVMIYQMITGQLPRGVWKPPSQRADVAPQWDDIVRHAMQTDPKDRFQNAGEIKKAVSQIAPTKNQEFIDGSSGGAINHPSEGKMDGKNQPVGDGLSKPGSAKRRATLIVCGAAVLGLAVFLALDPNSKGGLTQGVPVSLTPGEWHTFDFKGTAIPEGVDTDAPLVGDHLVLKRQTLRLLVPPMRDGVVRLRVRKVPNRLRLVVRGNAAAGLAVEIDGAQLTVYAPDGTRYGGTYGGRSLEYPQEGDDFTVEFAHCSGSYGVRVGGKSVASGSIISAGFSPGTPFVSADSAEITSLDVINLDGVPRERWPEVARTHERLIKEGGDPGK